MRSFGLFPHSSALPETALITLSCTKLTGNMLPIAKSTAQETLLKPKLEISHRALKTVHYFIENMKFLTTKILAPDKS